MPSKNGKAIYIHQVTMSNMDFYVFGNPHSEYSNRVENPEPKPTKEPEWVGRAIGTTSISGFTPTGEKTMSGYDILRNDRTARFHATIKSKWISAHVVRAYVLEPTQ
ncbi:hypothetical protein WOLCODRAFT_18221 [Wolfiporia cocos MD-104 SS10]|uniref:Uncharacterized protein n=1 Tax=Wolfiporia cocos (strain MD-104) TaxID=742152 RepID=A0A2H3JZ91_WOLCO|nr:hypothetical protein WOLCODRAFT_18221 [Wolfiporia cocos MD-104 SS10]